MQPNKIQSIIHNTNFIRIFEGDVNLEEEPKVQMIGNGDEMQHVGEEHSEDHPKNIVISQKEDFANVSGISKNKNKEPKITSRHTTLPPIEYASGTNPLIQKPRSSLVPPQANRNGQENKYNSISRASQLHGIAQESKSARKELIRSSETMAEFLRKDAENRNDIPICVFLLYFLTL